MNKIESLMDEGHCASYSETLDTLESRLGEAAARLRLLIDVENNDASQDSRIGHKAKKAKYVAGKVSLDEAFEDLDLRVKTIKSGLVSSSCNWRYTD